jgi:hypothetical protein
MAPLPLFVKLNDNDDDNYVVIFVSYGAFFILSSENPLFQFYQLCIFL